MLDALSERRCAVELLADHAGDVGDMLKQRILDVPATAGSCDGVAAGGTALTPTWWR